MISFTVYGPPVAQGRPRFARRGNFVTTYDPKKSKDYKDTVYSIALLNRPQSPLQGEIDLTIRVYRQTPKSFSKAKTETAEMAGIFPTSRPDVDNYVKGVTDALQGIIWVDDSQVVNLSAQKRYSFNPRIEIEIKEIGEVDGVPF